MYIRRLRLRSASRNRLAKPCPQQWRESLLLLLPPLLLPSHALLLPWLLTTCCVFFGLFVSNLHMSHMGHPWSRAPFCAWVWQAHDDTAAKPTVFAAAATAVRINLRCCCCQCHLRCCCFRHRTTVAGPQNLLRLLQLDCLQLLLNLQRIWCRQYTSSLDKLERHGLQRI